MLKSLRRLTVCLSLLATPAFAGEIHSAAQMGDLATVRELLAKDAWLANARDASGNSPLQWAARGGHLEVVRCLVEKGADVRAVDARSETALHEAAAADRGDVVDFLVEHGAPIDQADYRKHTSLHLAAMAGATEAVKALVGHGAALEVRDEQGRTPLVVGARERGGPEVARLLLAAGADVRARDDDGNDALALAAWRGYADVVDVLLDHRAPVPTQERAASQMLSFAAEGGLPRLFRLLVAQGADPTRPNGKEGTLLHDAAAGGSAKILSDLIDRGLDVRAKDRFGWTPAHYAALEGREAALEMLLRKGADPNERNILGQSPLNVAEAGGHAALKTLLLAAKADPGPVQFPVLGGEYAGQAAPGKTPKVFAPGIVSSIRGLHSTVAFSPGGEEVFWAPMDPKSSALLHMKRVNGRWTAPEAATFSGAHRDDAPFFAPDGKRLYFLSTRPIPGHRKPGNENIWFVDRTASGWSEPSPLALEVNALEMHWQFSVDRTGSVYFGSQAPGGKGSGDIYVSRLENGRYRAPENLGAPVNTGQGEGDPFIAPDGSYLLFTRDLDLYVSYRQKDGSWTEPLPLRPGINTRAYELCPQVSPDGRYLFFLSNRTGENAAFWVEAGFLEEMRKTAHLPSALGRMQDALETGGVAAGQVRAKELLVAPDRYRFDENAFNALGYRYLQAGRMPEAVLVLETAATAFPDSWNAWNSLGEACLAAGERTRAEAAYAKSLALNPRDAYAREVLDETRESPRVPTGAKGAWFGQAPPGPTPRVFAPGIVSAHGYFEFGITFTPDGRECYFTRRKDGGRNVVMVSRLAEEGWSAPEEAPFSRGFPSNEPHVTPDGRRLFFGSRRPVPGSPDADGIWVVDRKGAGWSEPRYHGPGMYASVAGNGNLYLTDVTEVAGGGAIVYPWMGERYGPPRRLGGSVNRPSPVDHAFITPDESTLVFDATGRPGGQGGEGDLWVCFRRPDGNWSEPQNLGDAINTPGLNFCPSVSPDGKYLFYTTNRDVYWVGTEILEPLRARALGQVPAVARPPASIPIPDYSQAERKEVPETFRWRIEDIYESEQAWERDLAEARKELERLDGMAGSWTSSASRMADALDLLCGASLRSGKLSAYASLQARTHAGSARFADLESSSGRLAVELSGRGALMDSAILKLGPAKVAALALAEPRLPPYRALLDRALRASGHTLSEEAQRVFTETATFSGGAQSAAMTLRALELPGREAVLPDGSRIALTGPAYWKLASSRDPRERRAADEGMVSDVRPLENTFAALLDTCVKKDLFEARIRNHPDCLSAEVFPHEVDPALVRQLLASVRANLGPYHRYLALRKKFLGLTEAHHYDLAQRLAAGPKLRFTFEEARRAIEESTSVLGPEYSALMRRAFDERWVDVYGHKGKPGGGSLIPVLGVHPFVLLGYSGSFFDLLTVAHELGHALHYVLSERHQPFAAAEPPYLLTEIPSTFNEILLVRHLLARTPDPRTRLALLAELLDRLDTLLVFDARVAELENAMHAHVEKGGTLTAEWLNATFLAIARDTYGHDKGLVLVDDYVRSGWNYPSTFFDTFRGYKVVLATVAALAMTGSVLEGGEAEAGRYVKFLEAGSGKPTLEILKDAGVDLRRPETVTAAMRAFDGLVGEMEALQGRLETGGTPSH